MVGERFSDGCDPAGSHFVISVAEGKGVMTRCQCADISSVRCPSPVRRVYETEVGQPSLILFYD
jgi:hypothetical protein